MCRQSVPCVERICGLPEDAVRDYRNLPAYFFSKILGDVKQPRDNQDGGDSHNSQVCGRSIVVMERFSEKVMRRFACVNYNCPS